MIAHLIATDPNIHAAFRAGVAQSLGRGATDARVPKPEPDSLLREQGESPLFAIATPGVSLAAPAFTGDDPSRFISHESRSFAVGIEKPGDVASASGRDVYDFDPHDTPEADYLRRMAAACCHDEAEGAVQCDCGRWLCLGHQVMTAGGAMCAGCLAEWRDEEAALAAALEVAA